MNHRIIIRISLALFIATLATCLSALLFYRSVDFDPSLLSKNTSAGRGTVFVDRNGRELRFLPDLKGERARWVPLSEIPVTVRNAFIAAEDERFYRHHGFDAVAIMRAAWRNIAKKKIVSGASTISQQVVRLACGECGMRNAEFGIDDNTSGNKTTKRKRSYRDKLIEIVRSVKMERMFSKDEILEQYLNRVPMGNNLVGVETAARAYFRTSVKNLSVSEAALLASLPKAPGMLNPYGSGFERLMDRRNWVLGRMEVLGLLSHEKCLLAQEKKPRMEKFVFASAAPHVVDMLLKQGIAGNRVRTTIDLDLQTRVQEILASHADRLKYRGATQVAVIVIHNPTMEVLASVGSLEYSEKNDGFNNGVRAFRSAGSALKPFLYALAIESGETVATLLQDTEKKYRSREGQYSPLNFDRKEYGPVTVRSALGNSLNLSAVKTLQRMGEDRFYEMLVRLDLINRPELGPEHYGLGMAIGNPEVSPEQLATAFAMLANGGVYRQVNYVLGSQESGVRSQGVTSHESRYILLPQTAYIISDILSDPTARALTFNRSRLMMDFPFRVAIKTGTSTFFRDLWAVGYTPDYTVAVWVGNFDGSATKNLSGSSAAVPIFADVMTWLYPQSEPVWFKQPKGLRRVTVCGYSGMKPSPYCDHTLKELFIAGTGPRETCTFHTGNVKRHELSAHYAGWLYDKNNIGSAGRFRLAGFGDDLNTVFQDPLEGTDQPEPGIHARNIKIAKSVHIVSEPIEPQRGNRHYSIGSAAPDQAESHVAPGDAAIKIVYPLDRDRFVLNGYERNQQIKFQAVLDHPASYVDWFVNGKLFKRTGPPYQAYWPLEEGKFRITAVTPSNIGDSIEMVVE